MKLSYREQLIYELLFSEKEDFEVNINQFVDEKDSNNFVLEIKNILSKGGVRIITERFHRENNGKMWKLKLGH